MIRFCLEYYKWRCFRGLKWKRVHYAQLKDPKFCIFLFGFCCRQSLNHPCLNVFLKVSQKQCRWYFRDFGGGQNGEVYVHYLDRQIIIFVHAPFTVNWLIQQCWEHHCKGNPCPFYFGFKNCNMFPATHIENTLK